LLGERSFSIAFVVLIIPAKDASAADVNIVAWV
jgi:hypothetical protein